jgi:hypothetical protein
MNIYVRFMTLSLYNLTWPTVKRQTIIIFFTYIADINFQYTKMYIVTQNQTFIQKFFFKNI